MEHTLNLEAVEKNWEKYEKQFAEEEYLDIETHTNIAFLVPSLLKELKDTREQLENTVSFTQREILRYRDALDTAMNMAVGKGELQEFIQIILQEGMDNDEPNRVYCPECKTAIVHYVSETLKAEGGTTATFMCLGCDIRFDVEF